VRERERERKRTIVLRKDRQRKRICSKSQIVFSWWDEEELRERRKEFQILTLKLKDESPNFNHPRSDKS